MTALQHRDLQDDTSYSFSAQNENVKYTHSQQTSEGFEVANQVIDGACHDVHGLELRHDDAQELDQNQHVDDAHQVPQRHRAARRHLQHKGRTVRLTPAAI